MSIVNTLSRLRSNLFGRGNANTAIGSTVIVPPASSTQDIGMRESPTGRLGENPLGFSSFSYPSDVTNDAQNGHYLLFYVNVQNRTKYGYKDNHGNYVGNVKQVRERTHHAVNDTYTDKIRDVKGEGLGERIYYSNRAAKRVGTDEERGAAFVAEDNRFSKFSESRYKASTGIAAKSATTKRIVDSVAIYLPPNVADNTSVTYNDTQTGMFGFGLLGAMDLKSNLAMNDIEAASKTLLSGIKGFAGAATERLGAEVIEAFTQSEGTIGAFNRVFGQAVNPYLEVLFDSVNLRSFTYNFTFAPRDQKETMEAQRIIQVFRFHMVPEIQGGESRFLTLPSEFDIHYMYQSKAGKATENDYYNRIGTCVLSDCQVNYSPDGVKSFADGAPTKITMSLTFKELEALTKEKVSLGY